MNTDEGINMNLRSHLMETPAETVQRGNGSMRANQIDLKSPQSESKARESAKKRNYCVSAQAVRQLQ
jgi:hypothetical protein